MQRINQIHTPDTKVYHLHTRRESAPPQSFDHFYAKSIVPQEYIPNPGD